MSCKKVTDIKVCVCVSVCVWDWGGARISLSEEKEIVDLEGGLSSQSRILQHRFLQSFHFSPNWSLIVIDCIVGGKK